MARNLLGANPDLEWYASEASRFGLRVSSGRRPGSITSSGNVSMHSAGNALDLTGTPAAMAKFADYAAKTWGSHLEELIYSPRGKEQIKNGKPFLYSGQVVADHYDHVHIADTQPSGKSDGKSDGGISLTGALTASGLDLITGGQPGDTAKAVGGAAVDVAEKAAGVAADAATAAAKALLNVLWSAFGEDGARILLYVAVAMGGTVIVMQGLARMVGVSQPYRTVAKASVRAAATVATRGASKAVSSGGKAATAAKAA